MTYFHELMQYFDMVFSGCYLVPIILLTNIFRAYKNMNFRHIWIECILDLILGLNLLRFAVFMGAVGDITSIYDQWTYKLIFVIVLSFFLVIIHVIMLLKNSKNSL